MDIIDDLKEISTRGKVAFGIFCLESATDFFQVDREKWEFVFDELWKFCSSDMWIWEERIVEVFPSCVCDKVDFKIKDYQYLTKLEHDELLALYEATSPVVLSIVELTGDVGRTGIYTAIKDEKGKRASIPYLQKLIDIMHENNIALPDITLFRQFSVSENNGWGREFTREDVFKKGALIVDDLISGEFDKRASKEEIIQIKTITIKGVAYELWLDERLNMWRMIESKLLIDNYAVDLEIDIANLDGVVNWTEIANFIQYIAYDRQRVNKNIEAAQFALNAFFTALYREVDDEPFLDLDHIVFELAGIDYKGRCKNSNQKNSIEYDFFFCPRYVKDPYRDIGTCPWRAIFRDQLLLGVCRDL